MDEEQRREVAAAMEVGSTPELLPFLPELLADVFVLGSDPGVIVDVLALQSLEPTATRALDLGCGKGAVALPLATELGFQVLGVDLFEPFVFEARARADRAGVAARCRFEVMDLRQALGAGEPYDVVVYAGLGSLGRFDSCVGELRRGVRPYGFIVVNDGFIKEEETVERAGYEYYAPHEESRRLLEAHGDVIVEERLIADEEAAAFNRTTTEMIRQRVAELVVQHPESAELLQSYVRIEEEECEVLETKITQAVWLLQRR